MEMRRFVSVTDQQLKGTEVEGKRVKPPKPGNSFRTPTTREITDFRFI